MLEAEEARRGSSHQRGYGWAWQKLRAKIIDRDPVCLVCQMEWSVEVDHIRPKAHGGTDDEDNLQGICHHCHAKKSARDRRGPRE